MHPQNPQDEMIAYCKENSVLPEAWSPLIQGQAFKRELLLELAEKIQGFGSQLASLYSAKGRRSHSKSANPDRIRNNADVFGFEISDEDMERIASLRVYGRIGDPPSVPRTHQVVGF